MPSVEKNYSEQLISDTPRRPSRELEGAVAEATADGTFEKLAEGFGGLNPTSRITWDFSLPAGEEIVLGYTYSVYVRV